MHIADCSQFPQTRHFGASNGNLNVCGLMSALCSLIRQCGFPLCRRKPLAGHKLTYARERWLAANLSSDPGWMEFKFPSVLRAPKHLRLQCQGIGQCFPTWCAPRAIAQHGCSWYGDKSKMLWCGGSCGCHRPLDPDRFLRSSNPVFARTAWSPSVATHEHGWETKSRRLPTLLP